MNNFNHKNGTKVYGRSKLILAGIVLLILAIVGSAVAVRSAYQDSLKPFSNNEDSIIVTIEQGSAPSAIADNLKSKNVIKSDWAFEWYVRNQNLRGSLKAGTYVFRQAQSIPDIVDQIVDGEVATDLVTILPGQRLDQIRDGLLKDGFKAAAIDKALDPANYPGHPALTDKPKTADLEGYLYPESFQKTAETTPLQIIEKSLDEMSRYLSPEVRAGFFEQGLSVHQSVILASIIEQEVSKVADKPMVAQVLLKRYKEDMKLGADPTALYGAIKDGEEPSLHHDSPYNTRKHSGLPPGPIGNAAVDSLKAVAFPAKTDWLYFVAGDDGVTYFSKTLEEHEALTKKHCKELCKSY
ncbi:endolytic transglycosylase MltG [Candidatus Parcubacteria bacterium]|nr:endolytic transglycosylase MltG [Candidatus Parcubacteria bacterium]